MKKYVYLFNEGNKDMREILGGKGANLAEMTNIGLPVPQGFTISTVACNDYYTKGGRVSPEIEDEIFETLGALEQKIGKKLGDTTSPLLLSVRSGARASMPGMMDTILNLGLNEAVASSLVKSTNNPRFVYDSYRRFISMYADVVKGYDRTRFEEVLENMKKNKNVVLDTELTAEDMKELTTLYKKLYLEMDGNEFPEDPDIQLMEAVQAVFRSWNTERAKVYRRMNNIPDSWGTAVNVQEMVYGNFGDDSGTGVAFTRNPSTGENVLYGEYLINAQGEDVVAGIRTPESIETLKDKMPSIYEQFKKNAKLLEEHYHDMQDMEFTIENGKLYMLQTRNGKRTTKAAIKIALDQLKEGLITEEEAVLRIAPNDLDQMLHPTFDEVELKNGVVLAKGLAASPGAASGKIYFSSEEVKEATEKGENTILVRIETSPEDIIGMDAAKGILTVRGGMTSHAAVVARGMGKCCVSGCSSLNVDLKNKTITIDDKVLHDGDYISLDGTTGNVYLGQIKTVEASISGDFEEFMNIVDKHRTLGVKVNADTVRDAMQALSFGAEGIGLCRTEHMFFEKSRIFYIRQMILAQTKEQRIKALEKLLDFQRTDFIELFRVMKGKPITIRYLDPPLHEFLPHTDEEILELSNALGVTTDILKQRIDSLKEVNPMMGHRGCRLDVTYPEIAVMQTKAIIDAAIVVNRENIPVKPEIMIPLVMDIKELRYVKKLVIDTANKLMQHHGVNIEYHIGTMIEVPRACMLADEIAIEAEFFSFGTNDLTQLTYGFSRDDSSKFMKDYLNNKIIENDPFKKLDEDGVGLMMELAVNNGRKIRPTLELGICGEHGGDPDSIAFCHRIGLSYVSCSPYRVPAARLAAAQAKLKDKK